MGITQERTDACKQSELPEDLREWMAESELMAIISETADELRATPHPSEAHWSELIQLLAYSYSTGIYSSAEIEMSPFTDVALIEECSCCSGAVDGKDFLRFFRRDHRSCITTCLTEILAKTWKNHQQGANSGACAGSKTPSAFTDARRLPEPDFSREAEKRISQAVRLDCWMADA